MVVPMLLYISAYSPFKAQKYGNNCPYLLLSQVILKC
jgi:hypothetical protein